MNKTTSPSEQTVNTAGNQKEPPQQYAVPKFAELGEVEKLTQGSREQTSDEPGSGYKGG